MLSEKKWQQYGFKRSENDINCIVIHNTNNYENNAEQLENWLENECKTSQGTHYLVDDKEVRQVMPLDYGVYSTGKGKDYCSMHSIAIEICSNLNNDLYLWGQENAIALIKELMKKYNITKEELYFHIDFNSKFYCPANILNLYGNKKNFLDKFFGGQE